MTESLSARIISLGSYLPERVLTNKDLEGMVETSDEWIVTRTGVSERRLAGADEFPSDMGAKAAMKALSAAGLAPHDVELILVATMTPDYISPSTANLIQAKIQASNAASMDIQAACSGFIYAMSTAKAFIESGIYKNVLMVAAEKMSAFIDYEDRSTCVIFGDGASAALLAAEGPGLKVDAICLGTDGQLSNLAMIPGGGARHPASIETVTQKLHYFKMSGNEVFKHAVRRMTAAARECMAKAGLAESDISWLVPHQANVRIIDAIAKQFGINENKVFKTLHKFGNTSASSIGIALEELVCQNEMNAGEHVLLAAFGGGLTWGASILTKIEE